jgi:hypothetical protein
MKSLNSGTDSRVKSKLIVISTQRLPERTVCRSSILKARRHKFVILMVVNGG